jgi:hypothetical protein
MEDVEEPLEDEDIVDDDDDELEPPEEALATEPPAVAADPAAEVESIEELIVKKEAADEAEEEEEDPLASLSREERLEALDTRVVPMQNTEFVCKNCFLVKHRSQLKDKKRMLCRDCA